MTRVILDAMKVAISLPDDLFRRAEHLAQRLGIPRSRLYAKALESYVNNLSTDQITAALDAVHDEPSTMDPVLASGQTAVLASEEW
jgi:predicted DNA-binding protein